MSPVVSPYGHPPTTGEWIRDHLGPAGLWKPDYIYNMWRQFVKHQVNNGRTPPRYESFVKYVYKLAALNLVVLDRTEPAGKSPWHDTKKVELVDRQYYRLPQKKAKFLADPRWRNPNKALCQERGYKVTSYRSSGRPRGRPKRV